MTASLETAIILATPITSWYIRLAIDEDLSVCLYENIVFRILVFLLISRSHDGFINSSYFLFLFLLLRRGFTGHHQLHINALLTAE